MNTERVARTKGNDQGQPDTGDMVAVHQMFRREVRSLTVSVPETAEGNVGRAVRLGAHLTLVLNFLDNHHEGEDDLLWPLLTSRRAIDADLLHLMTLHHAELEQLKAGIRRRLPDWVANGDAQARDLLALQLSQLGEVLRVHLDAEERFVLPLVRERLTVAEWSRIAELGAAGTPRRPDLALALLGTILDDSADEERASFWATLPAPVRVVWRVAGRRYDQRYHQRLWRAAAA